MLYLIAATYCTILFSELLGDKSIYTISSLAARFRPRHVLCGVALAFSGKMLAAVLLGSMVLSALPPRLIAGLSAATFFSTAIFLWLKRPKHSYEARREFYWPRAVLVSFAAIFFSEWGDVGQLSAANIVARYQAPFIVLICGTGALLTKSVLAVTLGSGLRKRLRAETLRYGACGLCVVMGVFSIFVAD